MKKFNQGGKFGGGKRSGGGRDFGRKSFGRDDRERPSMHEAVCDECGRKCEVPFRPSGDKPIYCNDCFSVRNDRGEGRGGSFGRDRERPSFRERPERQMHSVRCSACGEMCEVPFRPTGDKPVFCDSCFDKNKTGGSFGGDKGSNRGGDQLKDQINALNVKLDKILKLLGGEEIKEKTSQEPKKAKKESKVEEFDIKEIEAIVKEEKAAVKKEKVEKAEKESAPSADKEKKAAKKAPAKKVVAKKKK